MATDPNRRFAELEIESSLKSFGSWLSWLGQGFAPNNAMAALEWLSAQDDDLPEELEELRDVLTSFGKSPLDEAIARVQGLEKAFEEIEQLLDGISGIDTQAVRLREIVETVGRYAGEFD